MNAEAQPQETEPTLPLLNPLITLHPAPQSPEGTPAWTLHNPVSNEYFKISWIEFECIARFSMHKTMDALINAVNSETTLSIDESDVATLCEFLNQNGLLSLSNQNIAQKQKTKQSLWQKMLHGYLFFTLPLIKPEKFLEQTLPAIQPLLSRKFIGAMLLVLLSGIIMTLQRTDEFFNTFMQLFSVQGIIIGLFVFAGLKILHEMAHAYTATKYGVRVPHMGVAFIVMYPVLYTETTGSWRLSSAKQRLHIGMAGILAELCVAGIALWIWHAAEPASLARSIAFTTVAVSLIGSLLVNLNPLMRFDGYYMLSDVTGIDNLQSRATAFARHALRHFLFGIKDPAPEALRQSTKKFLTLFGAALLIYRFFLFCGIALLVYTLFPKPLGPFLMAVELWWFIITPIWSELKIWWQRRREFLKPRRSKITLGIFAALILLGALPSQRSINVPAIAHAKNYAALYPATSAQIKKLHVGNGQHVEKGKVIVQLTSPALEYNIEKTQQKLSALENFRKRINTNIDAPQNSIAQIESEISIAEQNYKNMMQQKERLNVTAPFSGTVRDLSPAIQAGRYVQHADLLLRVLSPAQTAFTAYINEHDAQRISKSSAAKFTPDHSPFSHTTLKIDNIEPTNAQTLYWRELSSVYGGALPSKMGANTESEGQIIPLESLFTAHFSATNTNEKNTKKENNFIEIGTITIKTTPESPIKRALRNVIALFIRESGLN